MARPSNGRLLADRYRVVGRLGAGGMAVVVLAEDERLGRRVAVKRLHAESPDDAARRFEREAKLGASLNHPNIVAVYDTLADEDGVLIVMEYVEGRTLRQEMDAGPMAPARVIEVLSGIAAGLDHAHEHGVVHRDVKPANVLIAERDGAVKLTDLGIATAAERTNITASGVALGTASYMAPERLDGQPGGPAVDVYALAAVAFEMLSGRKAVTGGTAMEIARRVISQPPPDLAESVTGTPRRAAEALRRGLAKDPAERQQSAGELVRELAAAYAEQHAPPAVEPEPEPRATPVAVRPAPGPGRPQAPPARDAPARRPEPNRSRRGWLVPGALLAAAAAVVIVIVLASGGGGNGKPEDPGRTVAGAPSPDTGTTTTPAQSPGGTTPATSAPGSPGGAVQSFYTRAVAGDFDGAWALGTSRLHAQFGSLATFSSTFRSLRSISFPSIRLKSQTGSSATVAFSSVAVHTGYTDHCTAQAALVRRGSQWKVDHLDAVDCRRGT